MQRTEEIPRTQWDGYLARLSDMKKDHLVIIRFEDESLGDQVLADGLPLVGISLEKKGPQRRGIEITVSRNDAGTDNFCHMIAAPERLFMEYQANGAPACLDIEDRTGSKTLVLFSA